MHARMVVVFIVGALAGTSCISSAKYEQAHQQRTAEINARYDAERAETERRGAQLVAIVEESRKGLVEVLPGSRYSPIDRFDQQDWFTNVQTQCAEIQAEAKSTSGDAQLRNELGSLAQECRRKLYVELYYPALATRYFRANADLVLQQ